MAVPRHLLVAIGSRWSSSLVLAEAELALHRWREDADALRPYGWGDGRRMAFESLVDRLRTLHDTVSSRAATGTGGAEKGERYAARAWLDRAVSILESVEIEHDDVRAALEAIPPPGEGTATMLASVRAAHGRMLALRDRLDPEAADDGFFAEGQGLADALTASLAAPPSDALDRADALDALDGEVYLTIRGLNRAARRYFTGAGETARAGQYVFQFLVVIGHGVDALVPWSRDS